MFFPREGQYAWALAAPQWLGLQLQAVCSGSLSPTALVPGCLLAHGQLGSEPEETCSHSGCNESGSLVLTPSLGKITLKRLAKQP